jgi:hypothetical protein
MDDESKQLLTQILAVQKEQAELLKKHLPPLWRRLRFSLLSLLILMTLSSVGMGILLYRIPRPRAVPGTMPTLLGPQPQPQVLIMPEERLAAEPHAPAAHAPPPAMPSDR